MHLGPKSAVFAARNRPNLQPLKRPKRHNALPRTEPGKTKCNNERRLLQVEVQQLQRHNRVARHHEATRDNGLVLGLVLVRLLAILVFLVPPEGGDGASSVAAQTPNERKINGICVKQQKPDQRVLSLSLKALPCKSWLTELEFQQLQLSRA